jgi:hypothetical protein
MAGKVAVPAHERVEEIIILIRGEKVILDRDLAVLYGVETRSLVQAVRRNRSRFPSDFMFQLNRRECSLLTSQIVISNGHGGTRHRPYAFTEQGVAVLSPVPRSTGAVQVKIEKRTKRRDLHTTPDVSSPRKPA